MHPFLQPWNLLNSPSSWMKMKLKHLPYITHVLFFNPTPTNRPNLCSPNCPNPSSRPPPSPSKSKPKKHHHMNPMCPHAHSSRSKARRWSSYAIPNHSKARAFARLLIEASFSYSIMLCQGRDSLIVSLGRKEITPRKLRLGRCSFTKPTKYQPHFRRGNMANFLRIKTGTLLVRLLLSSE